MVQDLSTQARRKARSDTLKTARLVLRRPTLADAKAIARLANDRRIAENTRYLPHPYSQDHAEDFIRSVAALGRDIVFLIDYEDTPVGTVGIHWSDDAEAPELGYWLGVDFWGLGLATEAARGAIDYFFEQFDVDQLRAGARVANPASRNVLEKCGFQWTGVELHRFEALGSSSPVDRFRLSRSVWSSLKSWSSARRVG